MRFRQVHLDFHTSEHVPHIGRKFSKSNFQEMLRVGHVDSITVFAKCHHGWAYFPSATNEMHPELDYDLLGAQIEAAHEIGVNVPVYLSVGLDERLAWQYSQWLIRSEEDRTNWVDSFMKPGYHQFCLNTPYLDIVIKQIQEVARKYDADGIFLDIVGERTCYCPTCLKQMQEDGLDPHNKEHVIENGRRIYANYTKSVRDAIDEIKPGLPVFHNAGHIHQGRRDLMNMNTHLELESLPTGGWGYDHFPLSARYAQPIGMDFLGMTGKFHTFWGEFGGYKHPNALRYETSLNLAHGARCSIGDQLHPEGEMDKATYELIGKAYAEVQRKEAWCAGTVNHADVALLTVEAAGVQQDSGAMYSGKIDMGAGRMLLEGKILFDVVDLKSDWSPYRVLILPDAIVMTAQVRDKVEAFIAAGGKVLATGRSGLNEELTNNLLPLGFQDVGANPFRPDYFRPAFALPNLGDAAYIMYGEGRRIELTDGTELGRREDPYFNRQAFRFCSHQHTPTSAQYGGPGMVESKHGIYIAWNVFEDYATKGSLVLREMVVYALRRLLGEQISLKTTLPAQGITTLQHQSQEKRFINHLLYASPVKRGERVEIIEDIIPLFNIEVEVRLPEQQVKRVYLAPQMTEIGYEATGRGIRYVVPQLECHQMVVLEYN
ncbi:beta-galactosidase trimerization domain-containing protein [Paenibacillus apiarius]|uniref:Beta-galactosidase trimerization domain-containing protein n=1 Tax=Paenibacillus apiarius TaxID=46240 RepID=A0ABT4DXB8_9BACL|nr:beta-galactosidase trimerization domain-containing protein [Paenibacillus apiarius]MCY9512958.1 beta-galactosidase trimerization domain-containing protein [Paenibacillus apiarius]MCY9521993.1 beta-galactosidase trimerization domain-containing protein [Paenibacillus apiarius]MCY9555038.1 beta-galactosidase trimerization domain-containing protein [Paenibacillus apiarius]MCY9558058.1 beta-galactosidase trimerization domain-containing protein [Paenibacillus apiarius]MCY9686730.1 beta-galactosid